MDEKMKLGIEVTVQHFDGDGNLINQQTIKNPTGQERLDRLERRLKARLREQLSEEGREQVEENDKDGRDKQRHTERREDKRS